MAWRLTDDGRVIGPGDTIRATVYWRCLEGGDTPDTVRAALRHVSSIAVIDVARPLIHFPLSLSEEYYITARPTRTLTAGELRSDLPAMFEAMNQGHLVPCFGFNVGRIEIQETSWLPDVPTSTAVSLGSLALIGVVGLIVATQLGILDMKNWRRIFS